MRKLLLALSLIVAAPAYAQDCGVPAALNDGWARATPAEVGFDAERLCQLDNLLAQWPQRNIHAVLVARRGKLVMERYFAGPDERYGVPVPDAKHGPETLHDLRSISKSVTSLLVGIASGEGKFPALDSSAIDFFPDLASLRTADNARITFKHLLSMSSGFDWNESLPYSDPANSERRLIASAFPQRFVFEQPLIAKPGETYNYNGGNTHLLGAAVAKAVGVNIETYAREKLYAPLDITQSEWIRMGANGEYAMASGVRLRPRDTAKFGEIMLRDGVWNGKQVLPKGWAAESIKPRINGSGIFFYGYQWWLGRYFLNGKEHSWFAGFGWGGQRLFVVPSLDIVVMINAGHYGSALQNIITTAILNDLVMPSVKD